MSTKAWTPAQRRAIKTRGTNLLVSAAAGTGKTAVLVERILQRITDPAAHTDIDQLLVVTFTGAAATEMRQRIGAALTQLLATDPDNQHLLRQSALLTRASIMTLHAFCLDVVRHHFDQLDLDPSFRVADNIEAELLRQDALEEVFESYYAQGQPLFLALVDAYGGSRDDTALQETVLRLHDFAYSHPSPHQWLSKAAEAFGLEPNSDIDTLPWVIQVRERVLVTLQGVRQDLLFALARSQVPLGPATYTPVLQEDLSAVDKLISAVKDKPWLVLHQALNEITFQRLPVCRAGNTDQDIKEEVRQHRDKAKKTVSGLRQLFFKRSVEEMIQDLRDLKPLMSSLVNLVEDFDVAYSNIKRARGLVDFHDLEHFCLRLLSDNASNSIQPSRISLDLQDRFSEVLVDEYQDINAIQEAVLQLVSRQHHSEPNLFMVGDVKQSIYRFRLAEPGLFIRKYTAYSQPNAGGLRIDLPDNFRCRAEIVNAVNFVFSQIMTKASAEIDYDQQAALICRATYPPHPEGETTAAAPVEVHLLDYSAGVRYCSRESEEDNLSALEDNDLSNLQLEARAVAHRIRKMVETEQPVVYDPDTEQYRALTYRDIVVLLRATHGPGNVFLDEFKNLGIPGHAELGSGYFAETEVQTMLALLQVIDNPRQDIPLAAVLRSPICGFTAEDLAQIRLADPRGDFWDAVQAAALAEEPPGPQLRGFLESLTQWRTAARRRSVAELLRMLYHTTGYEVYVRGLPGSAQRLANLRGLFDRARQFESTSLRGLFRFLGFIARLQSDGQDLGAVTAKGDGEDVVRIMSIHRAKGLEFPVVIIAGLGRRFNRMEQQASLLLHRDLGFGPNYVDTKTRVAYPSIARHAVAWRLETESLAEELRLLYVAMTRARERLLLFGGHRRLRQAVSSWCKYIDHGEITLPVSQLLQAHCPLDWLGPALIRHPAAGIIRSLTNAAQHDLFTNDPSSWRICINQGQCLPQDTRGTIGSPAVLDNVRNHLPVPVDPEIQEAVTAALEWRYSHFAATRQKAKLTATEIAALEIHQQLVNPQSHCSLSPSALEMRRPGFLVTAGPLTAAERGVAIHLVMQTLDLHQPMDITNITKQIDAMVSREIITPEQAKVVDPHLIEAFFASSLGQRVMAAHRVYRELPFTMAMPLEELSTAEEPSIDESVLVQGIMDCLFQETAGDAFVLIDYKTGRVKPDQLGNATAAYQKQINLYTHAVETILRQPVKERYLYFFDLQQAFRL